MGDYAFLDIVLFAMVALFLVLRLRAVLGKRTGNERRHSDPISTPTQLGRPDSARPDNSRPDASRGDDNVINLPGRGGEREGSSDPIAAGVAEIRAADRNFDPQQFVGGARAAFEMVLAAFAQGDVKTLRNLLSDEVYANFAREIDRREKAGEKLESTIVRMRSADVVEARMEGSNAMVTVKFMTEQVNVLRDEKGEPLPGQTTAPADVIDLWTFARNTRTSDPNWLLVATGTAH